VARTVCLQHRAPQVHVLLGRLLEIDEALGGEDLGALVDLLDVGEPRHRPEAAVAAGLGVPEHRRFPAQGVEHSPGLVADEDIEIGQVNVLERDRLGRVHGASFRQVISGQRR
jgi:hypothetical protein